MGDSSEKLTSDWTGRNGMDNPSGTSEICQLLAVNQFRRDVGNVRKTGEVCLPDL